MMRNLRFLSCFWKIKRQPKGIQSTLNWNRTHHIPSPKKTQPKPTTKPPELANWKHICEHLIPFTVFDIFLINKKIFFFRQLLCSQRIKQVNTYFQPQISSLLHFCAIAVLSSIIKSISRQLQIMMENPENFIADPYK